MRSAFSSDGFVKEETYYINKNIEAKTKTKQIPNTKKLCVTLRIVYCFNFYKFL